MLPRRAEGAGEARWILLDYLDCVVHSSRPTPATSTGSSTLGRGAAAPSADRSVRDVCEHRSCCPEPEGRAGGGRGRCQRQPSRRVSVLRPVQEHGRYDLAFDIGNRVLRVQ